MAAPPSGSPDATGSRREIPFTVVRGFTMGAADVVPGVSGGTVALVFGIYHRLITAVRTGSTALGRFARLRWREGLEALKEVEWTFLVPLLVGIGLAVLSLASVIEHQLEENPQEMAALFLGLVAGSVVVAWQLLGRRDLTRLAVLVAVGAAAFVLLGLSGGTSEDSVRQVSDPALWAFFGAGALAICAMILPGISGSFILVMLGMYGPVLDAVTDRELTSVLVFGLGAVLGLALFSQALHWALNEHYDTVIAALIGLMLGSVRVLWPWPGGVESTELGAPDDKVALLAAIAVVAAAVVVGVNALANRMEHRTIEEEAEELKES